ncbi:MAG: hypothetical protein GX650_08475 [Clostridiales bacterium]|jgi:RimK family alpha-L-glutamate ligase|nr:hypothetical protein [Clostridiales bacterium]
MTGWIVYDADNVERNRFFIDRWMAAAKEAGIALSLVLTQQIAWGILNGQRFLKLSGQPVHPDFVVMRGAHPLLSEHLEAMDIPCFNPARTAAICNDKRRTHSLFSGLLPMMDTAFVECDRYQQPFPFPVVVKASRGCGGRQVYLAQDMVMYEAALQKVWPDSAVVQPLCSQPGQDVRVYVLNNRIIGAMQRQSASDFRSNVGLGANSSPVEPGKDIRRCVDVVLQKLDLVLAGVDFILHKGQPVFNEIEDAVGTRMLYMHTNRDIAADYLAVILTRLGMKNV